MSNKNKGVDQGFQDAFKQIKEAAATRKKDTEEYYGTCQ